MSAISAMVDALQKAHEASPDAAPRFIRLPNPLGKTIAARLQNVMKLFAHVAAEIGEEPVMSLREVAGGLGISKDYACVLLGHLRRMKAIRRTERGFYKRKHDKA